MQAARCETRQPIWVTTIAVSYEHDPYTRLGTEPAGGDRAS